MCKITSRPPSAQLPAKTIFLFCSCKSPSSHYPLISLPFLDKLSWDRNKTTSHHNTTSNYHQRLRNTTLHKHVRSENKPLASFPAHARRGAGVCITSSRIRRRQYCLHREDRRSELSSRRYRSKFATAPSSPSARRTSNNLQR